MLPVYYGLELPGFCYVPTQECGHGFPPLLSSFDELFQGTHQGFTTAISQLAFTRVVASFGFLTLPLLTRSILAIVPP